MKKRNRLWIGIITTIILVIGIFGCGGGSGSFSTTNKAAVYANSVAGHQSLQGGLNVGFVALERSAPTGSGLGKTAKFAQAILNTKKPKSSTTAKPSAALDYLPFLGLYFSTTTNANVQTIHYFTDSLGTEDAGTMTITVNGASSFDTNYASYPQSITATANVTGGKIPMTGSLTITYQDSSGANTMQGSLNLPVNSISLNIDLALSSTQSSSGSATITTPNSTFTFANVSGNPFASMNGSVNIQPQAWTGTGTITPSTGLFTMQVDTPDGHANAVLGVDGKLVITYPDGSGNTVNDPSSASLTIDGGGTTATTATTATTSTTDTTSSTSTTSTTAGTYATPVEFAKTSSSYSSVIVSAVSANGKVVGWESGTDSVRHPIYWSAPGTPSEMTRLDSTHTVSLSSVNSTGACVGEVSSPTVTGLPIYYESPSATPVLLQLPSGAYRGNATWINDSGLIVGWYYTSSGQIPCYWTDKNAMATSLSAGTFGTQITAKFVDTAGEIFGSNGTKQIKWPSVTSEPVELTPAGGVSLAYMVAVTPGGVAVGGHPNSNGNGAHPAYWAMGSTTQTEVPFVTGFTDAMLESMNASGVGSGYQRDAQNVVTAWVTQGNSSVSLQPLLTSSGGWTMYDAKFIDASGNLYVNAFQNSSNYSWVYVKKN